MKRLSLLFASTLCVMFGGPLSVADTKPLEGADENRPLEVES